MRKSRSPDPPAPDLYDEPITHALDVALAAIGSDRHVTEAVDDHHVPVALTRVLHARIVHALSSIQGEDRGSRRLELTNKVLHLLREGAPTSGIDAGESLHETVRLARRRRSPAPRAQR